MRTCIRYSSNWKYRLEERAQIQTSIRPPAPIVTRWVSLDTNGLLTLEEGYCWDGPSGPALDTDDFMRGSAAHDASHQLMRLGLLPQSYRKAADQEMRRLCEEDGMWAPRRWYTYWAVRRFAASAADPANQEPVKCAPGNCGKCKSEPAPDIAPEAP